MAGLVFPPQVDNNGTLVLSPPEDLPQQSIRQILSVEMGDVVFAPVYGCDPGLFESVSQQVYAGVRLALDAWLEPEYWALITTEATELQERSDLIEWASENIRVVPLPPRLTTGSPRL